MLLLIDNYDSFTYNLAQYFGELGCELVVRRNDAISLKEIDALAPERICISPGPCTPREAGISKEAVPIMRNSRCLPVHQPRGAHDFSAICFGDALMSQANTKNWNPWTKLQNDVFTDTRLARCARPWRNADTLGR